MQRIGPLFLLFYISLFKAIAQDFGEIDYDPAYIEQLEQEINSSKKSAKELKTTNLELVPVQFRIQRKNGIPILTETEANNILVATNTLMSQANIELFLCGDLKYYDDDNDIEEPGTVIRVTFSHTYSGCGAATGRAIVMNPSCARSEHKILAHEVGHALGLGHTHGVVSNELVDGSNCSFAADGFCDTPADPNLDGKVNGSCIYTGTATDANGDLYNPDVYNIMSYTHDNCMSTFSQEQITRMHEVIEAIGFNCCTIGKPIVSNKTICQGESVILSASGSTGIYEWFASETSQAILHTGPDFSTPTLNSTTEYYVQSTDGCSSSRSEVRVTVNPGIGILKDIPVQVADLEEGVMGSRPNNLNVLNDQLLFIKGNTTELWISDGTPEGTELLKDLQAGSVMFTMVYNNEVYIGANDFNAPATSIWKSDGTAGGTMRVREWNGYEFSSFFATVYKNRLLFLLNPDGQSSEIWWTDGSPANTERVAALTETSPFLNPVFTTFDGELYFVGSDSEAGNELWSTDGTQPGTRRVMDINPGTDGSFPSDFQVMGNRMYFSADDGANGIELWSTDGINVSLYKDINPGAGSSTPIFLTAVGDKLYFSASEDGSNSEPWLATGLPENTTKIAEINATAGSNPFLFTELNENILFNANDGINGTELWKIETGSLEASLVKNVSPTGSNTISNFYRVGDVFYFVGNDENGRELWVTDGTSEGTYLVADINPGSSSSQPAEVVSLKGELLFRADDGIDGQELFKLSGPEYSICAGESALLQVGNATGEINWYDVANEGTSLGSGTEFQTPVLNQNATFYADLTLDNCTTERSVFPVTVTERVKNTVEISPNDSILCEEASLTLNATPANGGENPVYTWYKNGNAISNDPSYEFYALQDGDEIFVTMESDTACPEYNPAYSDTLKINYFDQVIPSISISLSNDFYCQSVLLSFEATINHGGDQPSIEWYKNGNQTGQTGLIFESDQFQQDDQITAMLTSDRPCITGSIVESDPIAIDFSQCGCDTDSDQDGVMDCNDQCNGFDDNNDLDQDGLADACDDDADGDDIIKSDDCNDMDATVGAATIWYADNDGDGAGNANDIKTSCIRPNGYVDAAGDNCPNDANKVNPGSCGCGTADTDTDDDGIADCNDGCPTNGSKTSPGICGCSTDDIDSDNDGVADCQDECPNNAEKATAGSCGCDTPDTDVDGDGILDCNDNCPGDANKTEPGTCGCGQTESECLDCNGDAFGSAYLDECNNCVEGNSGLMPCTQDCHGDWGGSARLDVCDNCTGGNTGLEPVTDPESCDPTSIENSDKINDFTVYPNPFHSTIYVNIPSDGTVYITDMKGKIIFSTKVKEGRESLSPSLENGCYQLWFNTNSQSQVKTLMKY